MYSVFLFHPGISFALAQCRIAQEKVWWVHDSSGSSSSPPFMVTAMIRHPWKTKFQGNLSIVQAPTYEDLTEKCNQSIRNSSQSGFRSRLGQIPSLRGVSAWLLLVYNG